MTELELYKYIKNNSIEWRKEINNGIDDIIIFPYIFQLEEFSNLIKCYYDDGGLEIRLLNGYVGIWMNVVCEYYAIDINNVFNENNN